MAPGEVLCGQDVQTMSDMPSRRGFDGPGHRGRFFETVISKRYCICRAVRGLTGLYAMGGS